VNSVTRVYVVERAVVMRILMDMATNVHAHLDCMEKGVSKV
jgi:hypothetical protein